MEHHFGSHFQLIQNGNRNSYLKAILHIYLYIYITNYKVSIQQHRIIAVE